MVVAVEVGSMIGIFDSGSGGLSVLRAIRARTPNADIVYFGDLHNAPYGNKSREELGALTVLGIQKLVDAGATEIVSACNSVSVSIALPMFEILSLSRVNLIEMVGPTVASFRESDARVLVLATQATVDSGIYKEGFRMVGIDADTVAMPELVDRIEAGVSLDDVERYIFREISPHLRNKTLYTHIILGCTHFPLVQGAFQNVLDACRCAATIVDPAESVSRAVQSRFSVSGSGSHTFFLSEKSDMFLHFLDKHVGISGAPVRVV